MGGLHFETAELQQSCAYLRAKSTQGKFVAHLVDLNPPPLRIQAGSLRGRGGGIAEVRPESERKECAPKSYLVPAGHVTEQP